jgi:hypothetical protein
MLSIAEQYELTLAGHRFEAAVRLISIKAPSPDQSYILQYVVRFSCCTPLPRLPRAHEAREDAPAFGRTAGNLRVLLFALQAGGNKVRDHRAS